VLVGLFGCGEEKPGLPAPALTEDEAQQLDALGYLDFASEPAVGDLSGITTRDSQRSSAEGYDLLTYPALFRADLVDHEGRTVRSWLGAPGRWERAALTANGDLLVVTVEETSRGKLRALLRLTWEDEPVWKHWLPVHHYADELPDGRIATLMSRLRTVTVGSRQLGLLDHSLAILSSDGAVLRELGLREILAASPHLFQLREGGKENGRPKRDLLHANYFNWMPGGALAERDDLYTDSNVIVTLREQDTIAIFDWDLGELVWAWGQGEIVGPHDAKVLANGNLLIFDNRSRGHKPVPGEEWSRVIELNPLTREIVWQYRAEPPEAFISSSRGTVQRLPNGNTLIAASNQGRVFEVTADQAVVFEYITPYRNEEDHLAVLRSVRYPSEFIDALLARGDGAEK
jgi:hypothetical protein